MYTPLEHFTLKHKMCILVLWLHNYPHLLVHKECRNHILKLTKVKY